MRTRPQLRGDSMNRCQRFLAISWLIVATALAASAAEPFVISSLPYLATGQSNCGLGNTYAATCLGNWDAGEDIIYRLDLAADTTVDIEMNPGTTEWTAIALATNCPPTSCIAVNTGWSGVRAIRDRALTAGTYYILVDTYTLTSCIPSFSLSVTADLPPPVNDVCSGAVDLMTLESNTFQVDLCAGYANDYDTNAACTGSPPLGNDATYKIYLQAGEDFFASMTTTGIYPTLWLVTDCDNAAATCVAGTPNDIPILSYVAVAAGWYYLIVDSLNGCGLATIVIDAPVATEMQPWGGVKAMFK